MRQRQLDRAIADITGESVNTIRHRGFGLVQLNTTHSASARDSRSSRDTLILSGALCGHSGRDFETSDG